MEVLHLGMGQGHAKLRVPREEDAPLHPDDPAARVFTDFARQQPVTVLEHESIDEALHLMKAAGVRALVVLRDGDVAGLVTSYDIQGERVVRFQQSNNNMPHVEVEVGDVMTPWEQVPTVEWRALSHAHVRDVVAAFRSIAGTHIMVVERAAGALVVRGVISRTRVAALLGR